MSEMILRGWRDFVILGLFVDGVSSNEEPLSRCDQLILSTASRRGSRLITSSKRDTCLVSGDKVALFNIYQSKRTRDYIFGTLPRG